MANDERSNTPVPPYAATGDLVDLRRRAGEIGLRPERLDNPDFRKLYPFATRLCGVPGGAYHYIDEGEGEPVVMVHGNPTWSFFYRNLVLALREKHRCLVPDHIGCGLSDKPDNAGQYTLGRHIDNIESWLEAVLPPAGEPGGRFNLVVHDWGGPIGIGYAVRHPERIRRLTILNTSVFPDGAMPLAIRLCRPPGLGAMLVRALNLFCLGGAYFATEKSLPAAVRRGFLAPYNSWANRVAVHAFVKDIPLTQDSPSLPVLTDIGSRLDSLRGLPMLVQWGMRDWCFTPFFLGLWRRRFPDAGIDEYDAGHYLLEDAGDRIIPRIREFMERPLP